MRLTAHTPHTATFAGPDDAIVAVELRRGSVSLLVSVRAHDQVHQDRLRLTEAKQCERFCRAVRGKLQVTLDPAELMALQAVVDGLLAPPDVPLPASDDGRVADMILDAAHPWQALHAVREQAGLVGDDRVWGWGVLALASRSLPEPLWLSIQGAGALDVLTTLAAAVPEEWREHPHRLTAGGVRSSELKHRILVVDDHAILKPDARLALQVQRAQGTPVGLITAGQGALVDTLTVGVDESPAQTKRVQAALLRGARQRGAFTTALAAVLRRLPTTPVVLPYSDRIHFPCERPSHRTELGWLLSATAAMTLLHHRHRRVLDGSLVSEPADLEAVLPLIQGVLGVISDGLTDSARMLLAYLRTSNAEAWTGPELRAAFGHWTRYAMTRALDMLTKQGYLQAHGGGRGRKPVIYTPYDGFEADAAGERAAAIVLSPAPVIADNCRSTVGNITSVTKTA